MNHVQVNCLQPNVNYGAVFQFFSAIDFTMANQIVFFDKNWQTNSLVHDPGCCRCSMQHTYVQVVEADSVSGENIPFILFLNIAFQNNLENIKLQIYR